MTVDHVEIEEKSESFDYEATVSPSGGRERRRAAYELLQDNLNDVFLVVCVVLFEQLQYSLQYINLNLCVNIRHVMEMHTKLINNIIMLYFTSQARPVVALANGSSCVLLGHHILKHTCTCT